MNIKNKEIFINAIKMKNPSLSDKMVDSVSLILCLVKSEVDNSDTAKQASIYADNIAKYIDENKIKKYISYDLILSALKNNVTIFQKEFIKSLILMNQKTKTTKPAKLPQEKLISV